MLRCTATDVDDPTEQPRWGRIGKQKIEDTGPLTKKRMETIDDETSDAAVGLHQSAGTGQEAVLLWFNSTRMHLRTHVREDRVRRV